MSNSKPLDHDLDFVIDHDTYEEHAVCRICGAESSSLLTWCPGRELSRETIEACKDGGNIIDLEIFRFQKGNPPSPLYEKVDDADAEGWE